SGEQSRRHGEADNLCSLAVDNQFELGRLHHRQVRRLRALKDGVKANVSISQAQSESVLVARQRAETWDVLVHGHVGNRPLCQRFCPRSARRDRGSFAPALDEEGLVKAICDAEKSAAEDRADEDHMVFWLVLADQSEKRGIFSTRVRDMALAIIDDGKDAAMMHRLGMKPADLHKRAANLGAVRAPIVAQPMVSKPRKTMKRPEPYVFDAGGVYIYPTRD